MKYKVELSDRLRIEQQYLGFLETRMPLMVDYHTMTPFYIEFTAPQPISIKVPPRIVLGKRAELFFKQLISQSNDFEMVDSGIQLISDGITQGELDFILQSTIDQQYLHIELAYKFYLFDKDCSPELGNWVGPNRRDSLKKKLSKLENFQFPKLYSAAAKKRLDDLSIDSDTIAQKLYMPMQLFLPFGSASDTSKIDVNPSGEWLRSLQFFKNAWKGYAFFLPEKQDWFVNPVYGEIWFSFSEISDQISEVLATNRSPMVWVKYPSGLRKKIFITFW